jgi:hypothetical protein
MWDAPGMTLAASHIGWLEEFYLSQCDGDWEHGWGCTIETLDNPGWQFAFDLAETVLEGRAFAELRIERSDHDWLMCRIEEGRWTGAGGPRNLDEIVATFRTWVEAVLADS